MFRSCSVRLSSSFLVLLVATAADRETEPRCKPLDLGDLLRRECELYCDKQWVSRKLVADPDGSSHDLAQKLCVECAGDNAHLALQCIGTLEAQLTFTVESKRKIGTLLDAEHLARLGAYTQGIVFHDQAKGAIADFVAELEACVLTTPRSALETDGEAAGQLSADTHLATVLFCLARSAEVTNMMDAYIFTGAGSAKFIAKGLSAAGAQKRLIGFEMNPATHAKAMETLSAFNTELVLGSTDEHLQKTCERHAVDAIFLDADEIGNFPTRSANEWRTVVGVCRPKFIVLHNTNLPSCYAQIDNTMRQSADWVLGASGFHPWPRPYYSLRAWSLFIRKDALGRAGSASVGEL